jgi:hypothetical protein
VIEHRGYRPGQVARDTRTRVWISWRQRYLDNRSRIRLRGRGYDPRNLPNGINGLIELGLEVLFLWPWVGLYLGSLYVLVGLEKVLRRDIYVRY